jgi:hypothetical protein
LLRKINNQHSSIYYLLSCKALLKLSYNQILNYADYFIFDTLLNQLLLKKIKSSLEKEKFFFFSFKKNSLSINNLLIFVKQIIANLLDKIFRSENLLSIPYGTREIKKRVKQKVDSALQYSCFNVQLFKFNIINTRLALKYISRTISYQISDKKFKIFLSRFFLIKSYINIKSIFFNKSSKFYKVLCAIYFLQLDQFVMVLFKQTAFLPKRVIKFYLKTAFKVEHFIYKSFSLVKNNCIKKIVSWLTGTKPRVFYLRYLDNVFFSFSKKQKILNKFKSAVFFL